MNGPAHALLDTPTGRLAALHDAVTTRQQRPTPAEILLTRLIAEGHSNKQLAHRLGITVRALDNRVRRLLDATGICCRTHLVDTARDRGWLERHTVNAAPPMSEEQLQRAVRDLALLTGWRAYHTRDSRGSDHGWPDLVLAHAKQGRLLFIELKTTTGRIRPQQTAWLDTLASCGQETALWRPAQWHDGTIARILKGQRLNPAAPEAASIPTRTVLDYLAHRTEQHPAGTEASA